VACACNPSYFGSRIGQIIVQKQLGQKKINYQNPILSNEPGMVVCSCDPRYAGGIGKRIAV
jgi:hypothetical protein